MFDSSNDFVHWSKIDYKDIMGRPPTRPKKLRDGFYIEIRNKDAKTGIKIRRDSKKEMLSAVKEYKKTKEVIVLGEYKDGKPVDE